MNDVIEMDGKHLDHGIGGRDQRDKINDFQAVRKLARNRMRRGSGEEEEGKEREGRE